MFSARLALAQEEAPNRDTSEKRDGGPSDSGTNTAAAQTDGGTRLQNDLTQTSGNPALTSLPVAEPTQAETAPNSSASLQGVEGTTPELGNVSMTIGAVDVVITGKHSRTLDLPGSVDVIGEDQISKEVTSNALDLMRKIPGFAYQDYGNGGVPNGFMLRGFSSNHGNDTLVLIDGVPINDHSWWGQDDGAPDLNQLTSEEIERIEVIKGPLDARYGNWGRSGTVLITTRQAGDFWRANVERGSYNTQKTYASFGSQHLGGKFNQVYSVEAFETDGWRQNSAQQRQNAYAKWFYRPAKDIQLGLITHVYKADWSTGSYIDEAQWQQNPRAAFTGSVNDGGYKKLQEVALHVDANLLGRFPLKTILWYRDSTNSRYADWTYEGRGQTEDHARAKVGGGVASIETDWTLATGQIVHVDAGLDYRYFDTNGANWGTQARVRTALNSDDQYIFQNGGAYLKASYDLAKRLRISGGIREDLFWGNTSNRVADTKSDMKTYSVPTYKGGIVGNVLDNLSVYGNIGTTFRLPNQAAKYSTPAPSVANLLFWEAGFKGSLLDLLIFRYAYFQSTEKLTRLDQGQYLDDGKARRAGHEVELSLGPWKRIEMFTALTVHNTRYDGGANDGNRVPIIPQYIWKVGVQGEAPWGTGARVQYNDVGKWDTNSENTASYGGYRVIDVNAYQVLARNWSVALDVKNLLDSKYSEFVSNWANAQGQAVNQYMPSLPRTAYLSLRYSAN
jgi:iron complex outermembrane receptor protein